MAHRLLSVYVSNEVTRICEITRSGKGVVLRNTFEVENPKGSVEDGMILEAEELAEAIRRRMPNKKMFRDKLIFTVSSRKIANKEVIVPYIKNKKKIHDILVANAPDYFPMSNIRDYVYEYSILETVTREDRKEYRLSAVAVQKDLVESYKSLGKALKMPIQAIDYYGNSVNQILGLQTEEGTALVLHIEDESTQVNIMKGAVLLFKRTVPFGRQSIVQALSAIKKMPETEVEEMLRDPELFESKVSFEEYRESIRDLTGSVTRVVEFHTTRNQGMIVESAKVYGEGSQIPGFCDVLEGELGVSVTAPRHLDGVVIKGEAIREEETTALLPNLGAVLNPVDLRLPEEEKKASSTFRVFYIALGGAALISICMVVMTILNYRQVQAEKLALQAAVDQIAVAEMIYQEYLTAKQDMELIKGYYDSTRSNNEAVYQLILDLEDKIPEGVGITNFSSQKGEVTVSGVSGGGKEPIAMLVMELKKLPYVENVLVQSVTDTADEAGNITSLYNMTFSLRNIEAMEESAAANPAAAGDTAAGTGMTGADEAEADAGGTAAEAGSAEAGTDAGSAEETEDAGAGGEGAETENADAGAEDAETGDVGAGNPEGGN